MSSSKHLSLLAMVVSEHGQHIVVSWCLSSIADFLTLWLFLEPSC